MNEELRNLMLQAIEPEMHRKILLRAVELVATGWTTRAGARDEWGEPVEGTSPTAISWCLTGAIHRALFELVGIDVYGARGGSIREAVNFWWVLMKPVHDELKLLGFACQIAEWNNHWCESADEAESVLLEAAAGVEPE